MTLRQAAREREWLLLAAVIIVVFHRTLTTGTFFFRDIYELFIPNAMFLARSLHAGMFPLWDPRFHGGIPFTSPANSPFYPVNILYSILPPLGAFNLIVVAHVVFASLAAYWLARVLGLSRRAAVVAGAAYALSGVLLSTLNLVPIALAMPWVPLTIGWGAGGRRRELALAALCAAMPLLAGAAEVTAMMFVVLAVWRTGDSPVRTGAGACPPLRRRVLALAFIAFFAAAIALVQLLPGIEMMRNSSRSLRRDFTSFSMWSVDPRRLPELVIPQFLGRTDALDESEYWGNRIESNGFPYILSIYFGALVLLLAIAGAVVPRDAIPRRTLVALALLSLALAMGRALPFLRIVYEIFPPVAIFRYPVKALIASLVPLSLLAASGFAALEEGNERARRIVLYGACAVIALIVIFAPLFAAPLDPIVRPMLFRRMLQPVIVLALAIVALQFRRADAIAALVVLDLAIAGSGVNAVAPRSLFDEPPVARVVRQLAGDGRFTHVAEPFAIDLRAPSDDVRHLARFKLETLDGYTAATFEIPVIFHTDYDGLAPLAISRLTSDLSKLHWRDRIPIFAVAGVRALMTSDQLRAPGVVPAFRFMSADGKWRFIYTIPTGAMARFVSRVEFVPDVDAMRRRIESGFDPSTLILIGNHATVAGCGSAPVLSGAPAPPPAGAGRIVIDAPCDGYVLLAQSYDPDWRPGIRADYAFAAIPVRAGHNVIARRYVPAAFYAGLVGSIAALLILIGIAWRT
jgi:hypothetical protein